MKSRNILIVLGIILHAGTLLAEDDDYLSYSIPADARKIGPTSERGGRTSINYLSLDDIENPLLYGTEIYKGGQLIERKLYKDKREQYHRAVKHGVQRRWHLNGKPLSEEPYKDGVMHGEFKQWDAQGRLIARYRMTNGNGTARIYNSEGTLVREKVFANNLESGMLMGLSLHEGITSLVWYKDGHQFGKSFGFYSSGALEGFICNKTEKPEYAYQYLPHGPSVYFSKEGKVTEKEWYVEGKKVNEVEYAVAAAKDTSLPPYYADATKYQEFADANVREIFRKYRQLPRVKIPLEFDLSGNPVRAQ